VVARSEECSLEAVRSWQVGNYGLIQRRACPAKRQCALSVAAKRMPTPKLFGELWLRFRRMETGASPLEAGSGAGDEIRRDRALCSAGPTDRQSELAGQRRFAES
jgi:hypothetical protein